MIPRTDDGRVLFALPWHDKVLVGTTDTPIDSHSLEPRAPESEVDFILKMPDAIFRVSQNDLMYAVFCRIASIGSR